jgi:hypothetical protein
VVTNTVATVQTNTWENTNIDISYIDSLVNAFGKRTSDNSVINSYDYNKQNGYLCQNAGSASFGLVDLIILEYTKN